jgi:hypothetical protein
MKTILLNRLFAFVLVSVAIFSAAVVEAQTYTTIANGAWNSASTWKNSSKPPAGNIGAGVVINVKHVVTYSGGSFSNEGTINIENPGGVSPRLIVASGVDITNKSTGKINIINGELRQYRFLGVLELVGLAQTGRFKNDGGYVKVQNSFVEIAQDWSNESNGTVVFRNGILAIGRDFSLKGTATDTIENTSVSVGLHGSGSYVAEGAKTFFKNARIEVGNLLGSFELRTGLANGSIEFIGLKNRLTGLPGLGKITAASGLTTTGGLSLKSYCLLTALNFEPNGKFTGTKKLECSANYFPAGLMGSTAVSALNFSTAPALVSGSALQVNATYKYEGVAPGVDATVHIDSLINGATIAKIDDNTGGLGYIEGFQPEIGTGNGSGTSYAVFTITYFITGTSISHSMNTFGMTAVDIDGTSTLKEFDQIDMGPGSVASYMSSASNINITTIAPGVFRGTNVSGVDQNGIDTAAKQNMFTVSNSNVSSFKLKLGITKTNIGQASRQFGIYMAGFVYPNLALLPIDLEYFTAIPDMNLTSVQLNWATSMEKNVSHFSIEKSTDGRNYSEAGIVFAAGNSSNLIKYSFTDNNIDASNATVIYYRLRSIDYDGSSELSQVRSIRLSKENAKGVSILAYPNPVTSELRVTIPASWQGKKVTYEVFNNNGQAVIKNAVGSSSQTEALAVSSLAPGFYIVKTTCNGETAQQKVIKR